MNACSFPQSKADAAPKFDSQVKKGKRRTPGVVFSKKQFYRDDLRRRRKPKFL